MTNLLFNSKCYPNIFEITITSSKKDNWTNSLSYRQTIAHSKIAPYAEGKEQRTNNYLEIKVKNTH